MGFEVSKLKDWLTEAIITELHENKIYKIKRSQLCSSGCSTPTNIWVAKQEIVLN